MIELPVLAFTFVAAATGVMLVRFERERGAMRHVP